MISRKQFRHVQIARGLTVKEIIARTGIPAQSFMVLMDDAERDPSKLISDQTFKILEHVLGFEAGMNGLQRTNVIEWRVPAKADARAKWLSAVGNIRADLLGDHVEVAVMARKTRLLGRKEFALFIFDPDSRVKVVVTHADSGIQRALLKLFCVPEPLVVTVDESEYELTCNLVANSVYRPQQFMVVLGGKVARYTWNDVQAAAKEFNFTPDELIDLIVCAVDESRKVTDPASSVVTEDRILRAVGA